MIDPNTYDLIKEYLIIKSKLDLKEDMLNEEGNIQKLVAVSILNNIILSTTIFKKNSMVGEFLTSYFDIKVSKSMLKSRTSMCGKVTRYVYSINDSDLLINFLNTLFSIVKKIESEEDIFSKDIYDVIRGIKL